MTKPSIVCLCGSTKFKETFLQATKEETLKGKIVLSVGFFAHADNIPISPETKAMLDKLHLHKIEMADEVLVLNVGGYVGESTSKEIQHAFLKNKPVRFWEGLSVVVDTKFISRKAK